MVRIGVISDTHGHFSRASQALNKWGKIDLLLHAGDGKHDALALGRLANCPVWAVAGNTDGVIEPQEEIVEVGKYRILLIHGYQFPPSNREELLADLAIRRQTQIVIYGHTHKPYNNYHKGIIVFNPGSPVKPRNSSPSCGLIEIDGERIITNHLEIS